MAQGEEKAGGERPLAFLHQLARDIVDGRGALRLDEVTQSEGLMQLDGSQQRRRVRINLVVAVYESLLPQCQKEMTRRMVPGVRRDDSSRGSEHLNQITPVETAKKGYAIAPPRKGPSNGSAVDVEHRGS